MFRPVARRYDSVVELGMQAPGHRHHNGASACAIPLSCNPWVLDHMQLRDHVLAIAESIHAGGWDRARHLLELLRRRVSTTGGATERLAACFLQALAVRYSRLSSRTGAVSPSPQYFSVHVPTYFNVEQESRGMLLFRIVSNFLH
jgi:hypothetical protein